MVFELFLKHLSNDDSPHERCPGVFWPTDASIVFPDGHIEGQCARKLWYDFNGYDHCTDTDIRFDLMARVGSSFEDIVADTLKKLDSSTDGYEFVSHNQKFSVQIPGHPFKISGEFDILLRRIDGKFVGVEIKTGGGWWFVSSVIRGKKRPLQNPMPRITHLMQTMLYLHACDLMNMDVDSWRIIYADRGEFRDVREFVIELSNGYPVIDGNIFRDVSLDGIYERFDYIHAAIQSSEPPPRDYKLVWTDSDVIEKISSGKVSKNQQKLWENGEVLGDFSCRHMCPYRDICWDIKRL